MSSIIQELQIEAIDRKVSVVDLLRKAKVVAVKLDLTDFQEWIEQELNGYKFITENQLPNYRIVTGETKAWNPYHGWTPIMFEDTKAADIMATRGVSQSVGELDDLIKNDTKGFFMIDYPPAGKKHITKAIGFQTDIKFMLGRGSIVGILEAVRNLILDWVLKLEKKGIVGEGVYFSNQEKENAKMLSHTYNIGHIENFAGTLGNVSDKAVVTITQTNQIAIEEVKELVEQIKKYSTSIGLKDEENTKISEIIQSVDLEIVKDKPQQSKIQSALGSLKSIFEGTAGNVVAQGILYEITKLLTN